MIYHQSPDLMNTELNPQVIHQKLRNRFHGIRPMRNLVVSSRSHPLR